MRASGEGRRVWVRGEGLSKGVIKGGLRTLSAGL